MKNNNHDLSKDRFRNATSHTYFFLSDDSYQAENKGSIMMNKKKSLSDVSNPSILGRSNYTQLAQLRRRIDRARFGRFYGRRI